MTITKLHRVIWRLQETKPFIEPDIYSNHQLDVAIGEECGTSDRTLRDIKKQMRKHGLIKSNGLGTWKFKKIDRSDYGFGSQQEEERQNTLGTIDRVPTA